MNKWLGRHLPDLPKPSPKRRLEVVRAQEKAREDVVREAGYHQIARQVGEQAEGVVLRNHLTPAMINVFSRSAAS